MKKIKLGWFIQLDWFKERYTIGHYFFSINKTYYSGDIAYPDEHYSRTGSIVIYSLMFLFFGISIRIEK